MAQTVTRPGSEEYGRRLVAQLATLRHCRETYRRTPNSETWMHVRRAEERVNELISDWRRAHDREEAERIAGGMTLRAEDE